MPMDYYFDAGLAGRFHDAGMANAADKPIWLFAMTNLDFVDTIVAGISARESPIGWSLDATPASR